jgi:hypothetical protein
MVAFAIFVSPLGLMAPAPALEHIALEIIAFGEMNFPCDTLAARICRKILAERIAYFQWQSALSRSGGSIF